MGSPFKSLLILVTILQLVAGCSKSGNELPALPGNNNDNNKAVGASANELLTAAKPKLVVEINYMPGYQLQQASVTNLVNFLSAYLNKPNGIQVIEKQVPAASGDVLTVTDIAMTEQKNRTAFNTTDQVAVYLLITNGAFSNAGVLGVAYKNTSMCLFGKTIQSNSGGIGQASRIKLESTVVTHEAGHLLGLVDIGSPMVNNHKDAAHPDHCNNSNCLMYYAAETTDIAGFLITGNIPAPDQNCRNDLKANGGK